MGEELTHTRDRPASASDPLLLAYLEATAADAGSHLEAVLAEHVLPLVARAVRHQLLRRGTFQHTPEEIEDVQADAVADVLARLRDLRDGFNPDPIISLAAYVTAVAHNACHQAIRTRRPNRSRLRNRLRYLFANDRGLALWRGASGEWMCGLAAHRGERSNPAVQAELQALQQDLASLRQETSTSGPPSERGVAHRIARKLSGGVQLDVLSALVADVLGITDRTDVSDEEQRSLAERLEATDPSALTTLMDRDSLGRLWSAIVELPIRQRVALLLNLRDANGGGVLALLPLTGTATLRAIATALEMPARELAELWSALPIEDARIAERLGVTRQQVINLRKSARERLARRLGR